MKEEYQVHLFDRLQNERVVYSQPPKDFLTDALMLKSWSPGSGYNGCDHTRYEKFYGHELPDEAVKFYGCKTGNIIVEKIIDPAGTVIYSEL